MVPCKTTDVIISYFNKILRHGKLKMLLIQLQIVNWTLYSK